MLAGCRYDPKDVDDVIVNDHIKRELIEQIEADNTKNLYLVTSSDAHYYFNVEQRLMYRYKLKSSFFVWGSDLWVIVFWVVVIILMFA
jgi:hypothetical protein